MKHVRDDSSGMENDDEEKEGESDNKQTMPKVKNSLLSV